MEDYSGLEAEVSATTRLSISDLTRMSRMIEKEWQIISQHGIGPIGIHSKIEFTICAPYNGLVRINDGLPGLNWTEETIMVGGQGICGVRAS